MADVLAVPREVVLLVLEKVVDKLANIVNDIRLSNY